MTILSTSTYDCDWQEQCLQWAQSKLEFEVLDFEREHFRFCEKLCQKHGYTTQFIIAGEARLIFRHQNEMS